MFDSTECLQMVINIMLNMVSSLLVAITLKVVWYAEGIVMQIKSINSYPISL